MVPLYWSSSFSLCVDSEFLNRRSAFTSRNSKGLKGSDALGPVTFSSVKMFFPLQKQQRCADVLAVIGPLDESSISTKIIW